MSIRCPRCGEEYPLNQIPQERRMVRCSYCGQEFSVGGSPQAEESSAPGDVAKELAQQYFADIPDAPAEEYSVSDTEPVKKDEKSWSSEDDISEEDKRRQWEQLLQLAQKTALKAEEPQHDPEEQRVNPPKVKRFIQEKRWQGVAYQTLLLFIVIIPLARVILGRMIASVTQFSWMQPQIIPSLLYFIAAVILPSLLLRRTVKPRLFPAVLLPLPLIFDFWYLIPEIEAHFSPDALLIAGSALKIAVSLFALIMSFKPRKHPALEYKEEEPVHEPGK